MLITLYFASAKRVSDALADGYVFYGNPVMVMDNVVRIVGQDVIIPESANKNTVWAD